MRTTSSLSLFGLVKSTFGRSSFRLGGLERGTEAREDTTFMTCCTMTFDTAKMRLFYEVY